MRLEENERIFEAACKAVAVNQALEQAENVSQSEMAAMTQQMFGGPGNLFGK